jgi:heptosyltransferase-2
MTIKQQADKILIIQTAFIGDVILATALVEKLHEFYPEAKIDFLVKKGNQQLLEGHPYLNEILLLPKKKGKYQGLYELIRKIRKSKYDWIINVQRFATTGVITAFSGAKLTVGFNKNPFSRFFDVRTEHQIDQRNPMHETARNQKLISALTDELPARPKLYPRPAQYDSIRQKQTNPYLTIAPASIWFTKQFPAEGWIRLIDALPPRMNIYLLGGPDDHDLAQNILVESTHPAVFDLTGKLSMLESAALMEKATLNYVNDSAPMHMASAVNAPVCAVFCSTVPGFGFGPLSDFSRIVQVNYDLYCRPCGLHGYRKCPQKHFRCAEDIVLADLLKAFKDANQLRESSSS